ncbi:hypothetical protein GLYMA_02G153400v4 [Glycine max]|uniref:Uncharacterized protein n=2 Tax=Glycine subgen. Soja TaxID=1462606 RepID=K7K8I9_SOYBN|nr:hypothetical protein JHK85_004386 [Glycine max]KAH1060482.1 hypothetical protein GYH30_004110 [Glycine max]KRH71540.1 hypothetical protein GLYMA_02G153400v4 [Glycine max]RZC25134.1 hypothetical protein D0Y65_004008 [Glycine soja]
MSDSDVTQSKIYVTVTRIVDIQHCSAYISYGVKFVYYEGNILKLNYCWSERYCDICVWRN